MVKENSGMKGSILLAVVIVAMMLIPVIQLGSGGHGENRALSEEGEPDILQGTLDLSSTTMEQYIKGENEDDYLGYSIEKADLNNDGNDDIILGAPEYNNSQGAIFIYFGGTKERILDHDLADVVIEHNEIEAYFGLNIKVGDVDNDGMQDILVGGYADQFFGEGPKTHYPKVFLFMGKHGWPESITTADADSTFIGSSKKHNFGWDIDIGDITGDGYDDIAISEIKIEGGGGGSGPVKYDEDTNIAYDATAKGGGGSGSAPYSISKWNDGTLTGQNAFIWCNGYGTDGAYMEYEWDKPVYIGAFAIYQYYTRNTRTLIGCKDMQYWDGKEYKSLGGFHAADEGLYTTGQPYTRVLPKAVKTTNFRLYNILGYLGQVSNPSVSEWEIYPPIGGMSEGYTNGSVYLFDGTDAMQSEYNISYGSGPGGYDHQINNSVNNIGLATTDLDIGDVNGDGYQDILIGSGMSRMEGPNSGGAQVVFGGGNMPTVIDLFTYSHVNITSFTDFSLSYITHADINGDGIDDILTSSPNAFNDFRGGVFAFYGDQLFPTGQISILDNDFMIRGPLPEWEFNIVSAGDMNDDGRDDLWIRSNDEIGDSKAGIYYLLYMNQTDDLPDPSVYNMKFETPLFRVLSPSSDSSFGYYTKSNLLTLDFNGDGILEIVAADFDGSVFGSPSESGGAYIYYQFTTEIQVSFFDILDLHGEGDIACPGNEYHTYGHVLNTWSLDDFRSLDLRFVFHGEGIEGETISFFWDRALMTMRMRVTPYDWIQMTSSAFVPDGGDGMYIYFNFTVSNYIPSEESIDMLLEVSGGI
ncbi:MAG: integrin alpha, partial [Candidatus Thermoplasmatota archaeon]|nr:integrin alpha [Candidatus Thermoplasmatota archaeon]